jgi:exodeoxyribonuclease-5
MLRTLIDTPPEKPEDLKLEFEYHFGEVEHMENLQEAMETYLSLLDVNAPDSAVFLCYSNFWAYRLNRNIRALLHGEDGNSEDALPLYRGDRIMVTRNYYFKKGRAVDFLPNGEIGTVGDVDWRSRITIAGLDFVDATFTFVNERGEPYEFEGKVMLNLLLSKDNAIAPDAMRRLRAERKNAEDAPLSGTDPYVGALQLKYGHAVTGHKAQGGEWENVFVLIEPAYGGDMVAYLRWLYTVITRASKRLFIVGQ